jgi:hypothetical protein
MKHARGRRHEDVDVSSVSPDRIIKLGYAYREAKALLSAVELGVFTSLSAGPLDSDALRVKIGISPRGARDFFDALVALRLLDRDEAGRYANTPDAALYLDRSKPTYRGGELEFMNAHLYERWNSLTTALRRGVTPGGAQAAGHYAERYTDPVALDSFAKAMTAATLPVAEALAEKFPWTQYNTIVDLGTAQGCLPAEIARMHPHLTGCGFDLPPLKPAFDSYVQQRGLSERLRFHPGDFFKDALPAADVIVLGRVLHNWDLGVKQMLLKKAYEALPIKGALIVYERLIDDDRRNNAAALLSSLNMLLMTAGGFDFSGSDCIGWMREIGFRNLRVEPLTTDQSMVVAEK